MENNDKITNTILKFLPGSRIILFGSRASGGYSNESDYDVLAITPEDINNIELRKIKSQIRKELAKMLIPIDIIITSEKELPHQTIFTNHIVKEALTKGIAMYGDK